MTPSKPSAAYLEGIESCIGTIYAADPEQRASVFETQARNAFSQAQAVGLERARIADRLYQVADAIGLVREHGPDRIQQWLADASKTDISQDTSPSGTTLITRGNRTLISQRASEIKPEGIEWVWPGRIAVGKLTLVGGKPGLGKSQVTISIAASVSNGGSWPCGEGQAPRGSVIFLSAEDGVADTIIPRLIASEADLTRVEPVTGVKDANGRRTFDLKADIDLLEAKAELMGDVKLIVIDPISAYMGRADGNGNVETRAVLEPIAEMANRLGIAVLAVTHLNKGSAGTQNALERFAGSIAFVAAARAGFIIVEDKEFEDQFLFLQVKNNIASKQKGLAYRLEQRQIEGGILVSGVVWREQHVERSADEALAVTERRAGDDRSSTDEIADFLRSLLSAGPVSAKEVEAQAVEAGLLAEGKPVSQSKAFRRARDRLGIKPRRDGGAAGAGRWVWEYPAESKMP